MVKDGNIEYRWDGELTLSTKVTAWEDGVQLGEPQTVSSMITQSNGYIYNLFASQGYVL